MIDPKELKKLADACRKAGIKHFKNSELEFTLTDEVPVSDYKRKKQVFLPHSSIIDETIKNADSLTQDELLFWSTGGDEEEAESN
jgi:hypothetical protein